MPSFCLIAMSRNLVQWPTRHNEKIYICQKISFKIFFSLNKWDNEVKLGQALIIECFAVHS